LFVFVFLTNSVVYAYLPHGAAAVRADESCRRQRTDKRCRRQRANGEAARRGWSLQAEVSRQYCDDANPELMRCSSIATLQDEANVCEQLANIFVCFFLLILQRFSTAAGILL